MTLDRLGIGREAVIRSVGGGGALRLRLLDMGLTPRTKVIMRKAAPMGDPIEINVRGYELTLRRSDAQKIEIEECAGLCSGYGSCPYSCCPQAVRRHRHRGGKRGEEK